jgi:hypothetical protein
VRLVDQMERLNDQFSRLTEKYQFRLRQILEARVDALVIQANSFGFMDGGIDLAYRNFFGLGS